MDRDTDLTTDTLFVGATRPAMKWGVPYGALLVNVVLTLEMFLVTRNLWTLLLALPIHACSVLLCTRDARVFELLLLWCRTQGVAVLANRRFWRASSYSPLILPTRRAPRAAPIVRV